MHLLIHSLTPTSSFYTQQPRSTTGQVITAPVNLPSEIVQQSDLILNGFAMEYVSAGDYPRAIALLNQIIDGHVRPSIAEDGSIRGPGLWIGTQDEHRFLVNRGDCYRVLNRVMDSIR